MTEETAAETKYSHPGAEALRKWRDEQKRKGKRLGRAPGATNKITRDVRAAMLEAWQNVGGVAYLERLAVREPKIFAQLLKAVIPREIHQTIDKRIDLSVVLEDARQRVIQMSHELGETGALIDGVAERVPIEMQPAEPAEPAEPATFDDLL